MGQKLSLSPNGARWWAAILFAAAVGAEIVAQSWRKLPPLDQPYQWLGVTAAGVLGGAVGVFVMSGLFPLVLMAMHTFRSERCRAALVLWSWLEALLVVIRLYGDYARHLPSP